MKRVCAWCNRQMKPLRASSGTHEEMVTHSICDDCADNLDFQMGVSLGRYIDSLKIPIIALDEKGLIIAVNIAARKLHENKKISLSPEWSDKTFECSHARLPEGCRRAVHCSGCAIRFITAEAYKTGNSQHDMPAHLNYCTTDVNEKFDLLISADRIENVVFLRITRL